MIGALPTTDSDADGGSTEGPETGDATTAAQEPAPTVLAVGRSSRRLGSVDLGVTWPIDHVEDVDDPELALESVAYGDGRFVAVGGGETARSVASVDGESWEVFTDAGPPLRDVVYGDGRFVAVGWSGRRAWSLDGVSWQEVEVDAPGDAYEAVAYGDGIYVAVGYGLQSVRSTDGVTWTDRQESAGIGHTDIAFGNGLFVATALEGHVILSEDGANWIFDLELPTPAKGICFGDGRFVILGESRSHTSMNAMAWDEHDLGGVYLERCAHGEGLYIALEPPDRRYRSTDGASWEQLDVGAAPGRDLYDLAFGFVPGA